MTSAKSDIAFLSHLSEAIGSPNISINSDLHLSDIAPVRILHIALVNHCILQSRINLLVAKQNLHLLYEHTLVDCLGSQGPPEFMWMDMWNRQALSELPEHRFHTTYLQAIMRGIEGNEQRVAIIVS